MKQTVLLVDDDPSVRAGLCRTLRKEPYDIVEAGSASEGLEILASRSIDVVVSDEEMPGMRGTRFLKRVRELYPDTVRFMLTGKATLENAVEAINRGGISRFFIKPCNDVDLAVSIRQGLQQRELMIGARRLLNKTKRQDSLIKQLEKEHPDITKIARDDDGAIVVDDVGDNFDELISEIFNQLDSCQSK